MNSQMTTVSGAVELDTTQFRQQLNDLRSVLETSLKYSAGVAEKSVSTALAQAVRSGKLEFEDLARVAGRALGDIAGSALSLNQGFVGVGASSGGGGVGLLAGLSSLYGGQPGRATGGPVSPGQAYMVGERGPEIFVPASAGRIENKSNSSTINVTINLAPSTGDERTNGLQTARQIARNLKNIINSA